MYGLHVAVQLRSDCTVGVAVPLDGVVRLCGDAVQVVDCRRILKWTYAYGYYHFGDQANAGKLNREAQEALSRQQEFFEFNQVR